MERRRCWADMLDGHSNGGHETMNLLPFQQSHLGGSLDARVKSIDREDHNSKESARQANGRIARKGRHSPILPIDSACTIDQASSGQQPNLCLLQAINYALLNPSTSFPSTTPESEPFLDLFRFRTMNDHQSRRTFLFVL